MKNLCDTCIHNETGCNEDIPIRKPDCIFYESKLIRCDKCTYYIPNKIRGWCNFYCTFTHSNGYCHHAEKKVE